MLFLSSQRADAVTIAWDGGGDGINWSDPLNWSTKTLPSSSDDIEIDGNNAINSNVHLDMDFTLSGTILITSSDSLEIDTGKTLTNFGSVGLDSGGDLNNTGKIENNGSIGLSEGGASLQNQGIIINSGNLLCHFSCSLSNSGEIDNQAGATLGGFFNTGTINNEGNILPAQEPISNVGGLINNSGLLDGGDQNPVFNSGTILNTGTINIAHDSTSLLNEGTITNHGTLETGNSDLFTNLGKLDNDGKIVDLVFGHTINQNTINNIEPGEINLSGTFENMGAFKNDATIKTNDEATFSNSGTLNDSGTLNNSGTLYNSGKINVYGNFTNLKVINNNPTGIISITGNLTQFRLSGNLKLGNFTNTSNGIVNNQGVFANQVTHDDAFNVFLSGIVDNYGYINNLGILSNDGGSFLNGDTGNVTSSGDFNNVAPFVFTNAKMENKGDFTIDSGGNMQNSGGGCGEDNYAFLTNSGIITVKSGAALNSADCARFTNSGAIINYGVVDAEAINPISFTNNGVLNNFGSFSSHHPQNIGIINNAFGATITIGDDLAIITDGIINNAGLFISNGVGLDAKITNSGTMTVGNGNVFVVDNVINNTGTINFNGGDTKGQGTINNNATGIINNNSNFINSGTITNQGVLNNNAGATIDNTSGVVKNLCGGAVNNNGIILGNPIVDIPCPDTTAPDTSITSATDHKGNAVLSSGMTHSPLMTFIFTGTDNVGVAGFQCSLDGSVFSACTSPVTYDKLKNGNHTFQVRAVDTSGNIDPSPMSFSWSKGK